MSTFLGLAACLLFSSPPLHCISVEDLAIQTMLGNPGATEYQDKHLCLNNVEAKLRRFKKYRTVDKKARR